MWILYTIIFVLICALGITIWGFIESQKSADTTSKLMVEFHTSMVETHKFNTELIETMKEFKAEYDNLHESYKELFQQYMEELEK